MASALISASAPGDQPNARAQRRLSSRLIAVLLTVALATLTPLAHGSPPDPTWIAGLYDDADHDDAILAVTASIASLDRQPLHDPHCVDFGVAFVLPVDEGLHATTSLSSNHTRAPPAS
jgi:hypothetical protein